MAVALQSHPRMVATRYFVIAVLLGVAGTATSAPRRHHRSAKRAKVTKHIDVDADAKVALQTDDDVDADADVEEVVIEEASTKPSIQKDTGESPPRPSRSDWRFAIGPYVWASSVQADVSFGPIAFGVDIGFISLVKHMRYGAEATVAARYRRFGVYGDITYGAAAVSASKQILGVMTTLTGNAGTLMLDSAIGYEALGGDDAWFSLEARSGVRYQRTSINGELSAAGFKVSTPDFVDSAADFVIGARGVLRPIHAIELAGAFDVGVAGESNSTWSATIDAGLHVTKNVLVTAGWRTLAVHRARVNLELSGPRAALQYQF